MTDLASHLRTSPLPIAVPEGEAPAVTTGEAVARDRARRDRRRRPVIAALAALVVALFAVTLMVGGTFY